MIAQTFSRVARAAMLAASLAALSVSTMARAADPADVLPPFNFDKPVFAHDMPFARHNVVLQVSSNDPVTWNLVLNNAQNLMNFFGQENVHIVVVAFGPGLPMLLQSSPVAKRIAAQDEEGVEFDACHNTMEGMAKKLGHMPVIVPQAVVVPAGVVRILQLQKAGFQYLKP